MRKRKRNRRRMPTSSETRPPESGSPQDAAANEDKGEDHDGDGDTEKPKRVRVYDGEGSPADAAGQNSVEANGVNEATCGNEEAAAVGIVPAASPNPFPHVLRCDTSAVDGAPIRTLYWHSPDDHIPIRAEEAMIPLLVRDKKKEFGMAKRLPHWRISKIKKGCRDHRVPLPCALSLRRHHIQRANRFRTLESLGLGKERQVRESAEIFERCVQELLDRSQVPYWSEDQQRQHHAKAHKRETGKGGPSPPTPDFVLKEPLHIRKHRGLSRDGRHRVSEEAQVCWIEAKMFYGASTIPMDGRSAVGSLLSTAEKYVAIFGPGAIVFMFGCGDQLAAQLAAVGVLVLDCWSRDMVKVERVREHQRSWCGNDQGEVLP